jgi:hypothetical protein
LPGGRWVEQLPRDAAFGARQRAHPCDIRSGSGSASQGAANWLKQTAIHSIFRIILVVLRRIWPGWKRALALVQQETVSAPDLDCVDSNGQQCLFHSPPRPPFARGKGVSRWPPVSAWLHPHQTWLDIQPLNQQFVHKCDKINLSGNSLGTMNERARCA